jgi:hypothetical protein
LATDKQLYALLGRSEKTLKATGGNMSNYELMNALYDIIAQNDVTQADRDEITQVLDYVDLESNSIVFRLDNGREFQLKLVDTYAPPKEEV